jgi:hypothetical protein
MRTFLVVINYKAELEATGKWKLFNKLSELDKQAGMLSKAEIT